MRPESSNLFFSFGDPIEVIEKNHQRSFSPLWSREHLFPNGKLNKTNMLKAFAFYPLGMAAYFFDTLRKIRLLVGNLFILIGIWTQHARSKESLRDRIVLTLDALTTILIDIVGIVIPPLAYQLDHVAQNFFISRLSEKAQRLHELSQALIFESMTYAPSGASTKFLNAWRA